MTNSIELQQQNNKPALSFNKFVSLVFLLVMMYFGYERYISHNAEQEETSTFISNPKLNDIYFLDLKVLGEIVEPKNKYKLAKVVRVSDEHLAIVYGKFFYQWQSAVKSSIEYGDLSNKNYFTLIPDYIPLSKIHEMRSNRGIYLVKRPKQNKLYGNRITPE